MKSFDELAQKLGNVYRKKTRKGGGGYDEAFWYYLCR